MAACRMVWTTVVLAGGAPRLFGKSAPRPGSLGSITPRCRGRAAPAGGPRAPGRDPGVGTVARRAASRMRTDALA
eukprot:6880394-Alexandrium_andersonii.AAC.1